MKIKIKTQREYRQYMKLLNRRFLSFPFRRLIQIARALEKYEQQRFPV